MPVFFGKKIAEIDGYAPKQFISRVMVIILNKISRHLLTCYPVMFMAGEKKFVDVILL